MKIKEFKEAVENIGVCNKLDLKVEKDDVYYYIMLGGLACVIISKTNLYAIDTGFAKFINLAENVRRNLFEIVYEFTKTPLDERQEEKRYIIPLPHLTTSYGEQLFLTHQGNFFPCRRNKGLRQTWKEKDLIHIPEEYREFAVEIVEVEKWTIDRLE